jgi:hypothetical protein
MTKHREPPKRLTIASGAYDEKLVALRSKGMTYKAIGETMRFADDTVRKRLAILGVGAEQRAHNIERQRGIQWTDSMDTCIKDGCRSGVVWDRISAELNLSRIVVVQRAKYLGVYDIKHALSSNGVRKRAAGQRDWTGALPAGHPDTWGPLIALTPVLGDAAYARA